MSNPAYKGAGQPTSSVSDGLGGWLGSLLGSTIPAYRIKPTAPQVPAPTPAPVCPPCKPCPEPTHIPGPTQQSGDACELVPVIDHGEAVIPVGPGPITIVIQPRA